MFNWEDGWKPSYKEIRQCWNRHIWLIGAQHQIWKNMFLKELSHEMDLAFEDMHG